MKWISVKSRKRPELGQKVLTYYIIHKFDGTVSEGTKLLYYLKHQKDYRKRVFSDKDDFWFDLNVGTNDWPVTHWMTLPEKPTD